jgi:EAL domain-containing protein (putative c-di-GMP-specific phosphodiesterase class I)
MLADSPAIDARGDALRSDVEAGRLRIFYQPVLDIASGSIVGAEALLRWRHPAHGDVSPDVFVPLAEDTGVIDDLGAFALRAALTQQATWMTLLGDHSPRFVAVNVSPHSLLTPGFPELVQAALADAGVPASALTLEITESAPLADTDEAARVLTRFADMGITLDIDDFGTGYSSLASLVRLPVHVLKMDKSMLDGLGVHDRVTTTVDAVITLTHQLGMRCVAEGVETADQLSWLRTHGCDMAQGYHISKPLPGADVTALIASGARW